MHENLEYCRHREKLEAEFFFEQFDPLAHFSLQFLFEAFPAHVNIMAEERIAAVQCRKRLRSVPGRAPH